MWTLRNAPASPFGRKVRIAAAICGLDGRIEIAVADTNDPKDLLRQQNPLGKIPALILEDGTVLFDSRVIVEFLDAEAGGGIVIPAGVARFPVLTMQALADGVMDASLLQVYEGRFRTPETHNERWLDSQRGKVERGLAIFEANPPALAGRPHIGQIALACALGYLDLRFEGTWRSTHPRLVAWLDDFSAKVPSFEATRPTP
jgi:glutathione S-transferase